MLDAATWCRRVEQQEVEDRDFFFYHDMINSVTLVSLQNSNFYKNLFQHYIT